MEDMLRHLGQRLQELRSAARLTQDELAQRLGVGQSYIAAIEGAKRGKQPTLEFLANVSRFFGVGFDDLLGVGYAAQRPALNDLDALPPDVRAPIEDMIRQLARKQRSAGWRAQSGLTHAIAGEAGLVAASRRLGVVVSPEDDRILVEQT